MDWHWQWGEELSVDYDVRYKAGERQDTAVFHLHEYSLVAVALGMRLSDAEDTLCSGCIVFLFFRKQFNSWIRSLVNWQWKKNWWAVPKNRQSKDFANQESSTSFNSVTFKKSKRVLGHWYVVKQSLAYGFWLSQKITADLTCKKQSRVNDLIMNERKTLHMNRILVAMHYEWTQDYCGPGNVVGWGQEWGRGAVREGKAEKP